MYLVKFFLEKVLFKVGRDSFKVGGARLRSAGGFFEAGEVLFWGWRNVFLRLPGRPEFQAGPVGAPFQLPTNPA